MKKKIVALLLLGTLCVVSGWYLFFKNEIPPVKPTCNLTNLVIKNSYTEKVKVYVTLQSTDSVLGLFGITDTISWCKGYFWAMPDSSYSSNTAEELLGVVISFGGDNLPCQVAVPQGYPWGINIFECSINTQFEVFDISCEDGINSIISVSVSDTINWSTGDGDFQANFRSATDTFPLMANLNRRGIFPYRCTDCKDTGTAVPQNCFNLKDTCNTNRICQVARTNNIGGTIYINYISPTLVPLK